jgi:VanZ family protein
VFLGLLLVALSKAFAPGGGPYGGFIDKLQHAFAFYVLALAAAAATPRSPLLLTAACLALLGALIEVLQGPPLFRRSCDLEDWLADMAGVLLAYAPLWAARWRTALRT